MTERKKPRSVLAQRLRAARTALGVSQMKLGVLAGIDEYSASARINQYEQGVHEPAYATAEQLAGALGVPTAYLYAREDWLAEVILRAHRLSADDRKLLLAGLRARTPD